jgi:hypothetical protein
MDQILDAIRAALKEQRHLGFHYQGLPRVVLPMAVGIAKVGGWKLRGQQVGGQSSSGSVGDGTPKLFYLSKIGSAVVLDTHFDIPAEYARGDSAFRIIDTEL